MLSMLPRNRASSAGMGVGRSLTNAILGGRPPRPLERSGALLARWALLAGRLARDERRVHVLQDDCTGDLNPGDVVTAGDLEHDLLEDLFHDRPQTSGAGATQQRLVRDRGDGPFVELELDA